MSLFATKGLKWKKKSETIPVNWSTKFDICFMKSELENKTFQTFS